MAEYDSDSAAKILLAKAYDYIRRMANDLRLEPLRKIRTGVLENMLKQWGWTFNRSAKHVIYSHPTVPVTLKLGHEHSTEVDKNKMELVLKDAGLRMVHGRPDQLEVRPNHPFREHYIKSGHLKEETAAPAKPTTWKDPAAPHAVQVPLHLLQSTVPTDSWGIEQAAQHLSTEKGAPHVTVMEEDGKMFVDRGYEYVEAAKRAGYTHAPVLTIDGKVPTLHQPAAAAQATTPAPTGQQTSTKSRPPKPGRP